MRVIDDARQARVRAGLTQDAVGRAIGVSHARVGRFERGEVANPDLGFMVRTARSWAWISRSGRTPPAIRSGIAPSSRCSSASGRASIRRSAGAPRSRSRSRATCGPGTPRSAHPRPRWRARVEAETRIADGQALERKLALKLRDDPDGHLILLVADTRVNRSALRAIREGIRNELPLDTRELLVALRAGNEPNASGIVIM